MKQKTKLEDKVSVVKQDWEESERYWGVRPDGYSLHKTVEDCSNFIKEYWDSMPDAIPDEYSRPCGNPYLLDVSKDIYRKITRSKNGIRLS